MSRSLAQRRYERRVVVLSLAYAAALFGVTALFRQRPPTGVAAYLAATLPALPIVGIFAALGRYLVDERDEYLKLLFVRQSLVATGLTLALATIWGFLENFGLAPHVPAFAVPIVWFGGLGLGSCVNRLLDRGAA